MSGRRVARSRGDTSAGTRDDSPEGTPDAAPEDTPIDASENTSGEALEGTPEETPTKTPAALASGTRRARDASPRVRYRCCGCGFEFAPALPRAAPCPRCGSIGGHEAVGTVWGDRRDP